METEAQKSSETCLSSYSSEVAELEFKLKSVWCQSQNRSLYITELVGHPLPLRANLIPQYPSSHSTLQETHHFEISVYWSACPTDLWAPLAKWGLLPEPRFRHIVGTQHCCLELRCLSSSPEANPLSLPDSPAGTRRQCPATEPSLLPLSRPRAFSISWAGLQISTPVLSCWESAPMFPGQVWPDQQESTEV